jgi:hypothetical protein
LPGQFEDSDDEAQGREPLLFVDVNLGQTKTRIALYEKSKPERVAAKFVRDNNLDVQVQESLTTLLRQQLHNALANIDEEVEHEE